MTMDDDSAQAQKRPILTREDRARSSSSRGFVRLPLVLPRVLRAPGQALLSTQAIE